MTFESLNLSADIVSAVTALGYVQPTPIQAQSIPLILAGHDLLAGAQTGTGKTAAFTLPLLQSLSQADQGRQEGRAPRALILTPTRELAAQINDNIIAYGKHLALSSVVVFGGVGMTPQINAIAKGVDILVATPGRLLDLHSQGYVDLSAVRYLVLDEADRMLDMGFIHDVRKVLAVLPDDKQSLLFSATFSDEIRKLANSFLKNPQHIQVTPPNTTVQRISQVICPVGRQQKKAALLHIITSRNWNQVLVFTRTKFGANHVAEFLNKNGVSAMALHGNKSQSARTQALSSFKAGDLRVLVATDIAARGIDIDELPHVVNYEIPNVPEDYVHRIGRTGRAGNEGHAISLVCLDEEGFMMEIERFTKQEIPVELMPEFAPPEDEVAEPIAMGRQTLWGGAGKPPSREVMQAAAKAARKEMMERIHSKRVAQGSRKKGPEHKAQEQDKPARAKGTAAMGGATESDMAAAPQGEGAGEGAFNPNPRPLDADGKPLKRRNRFRAGGRSRAQRSDSAPGAEGGQKAAAPRGHGPSTGYAKLQGARPAKPNKTGRGSQREQRSRDPMLRADAHLGTQTGISLAPAYRGDSGRQPDPMRTSVDSMAERGRRNKGGNRNKNRGPGGISPLQHSGLAIGGRRHGG